MHGHQPAATNAVPDREQHARGKSCRYRSIDCVSTTSQYLDSDLCSGDVLCNNHSGFGRDFLVFHNG
jgi:hypothetical protein